MAAEPFQDRVDAGKRLASALRHYAGRPGVVVLALPRGGVPVACEVARALQAPLDVFIVRKLGVPGQEELAMGAIATGGVLVMNLELVHELGIARPVIDEVAERERAELARRERAYRDDHPPLSVAGKTAILVDDGLATGATMRAAVAALSRQAPARIVIAVPVAAAEICTQLARAVDEMVCLATPPQFYAVGMWYRDFKQTTDEEVRDLLRQARRTDEHAMAPGTEARPAASGPDPAGAEDTIPLRAGDVTLEGNLFVPATARGLVLFAHGSGSGRHSPRNRFVARALQAAGLATLLIDLLTPEEERIDHATQGLRFDISLLAERLIGVTGWITGNPSLAHLSLGYFGASTGAAAALVAAAERPRLVRAVVSRGGRPDLAGDALPRVQAPTLLIVGGGDEAVVELNRQAAARLQVEQRVEIIPGATHLFVEPGALEQVARLAAYWFNHYLTPAEPGT